MEGKSRGLTDGGGYGSRPQTLATEGFAALAMAGDRTFYRSDFGNDGFRMGDLSVRTGEEFAAAFSQRGGGDGRSLFNRRNLQAPGSPFGYEDFTGARGQMPFSSNPEVSRFGNDYSEAYQVAQSFRAPDEGRYQSEEGFAVAQAEFQRSSVRQDDLAFRKMKFMCSFGGKILPRPSDGSLRYVGGETRIITASRGVRLAELMQKMLEIYGQAVLLKYQLPNEELDALVSVSSNEDLENMMDEYERLLEGSGDASSRLRVFLFSAADSDLVPLASIGDRRNSERNYVDAVNGIMETGFGKSDDGMASVSSRHLENLIGLDVADNWNSSTPWDPEGMSTTKITPRDAVNLGHPPVPSSSFSSKQAVSVSGTPSVASSSPSSSRLGHLKQSGAGDVSEPVFPEQNSKSGGRAYPVLRPPDGGGGGYGDLDYGTATVLPSATLQNELPPKAHHDYLWPPVSYSSSGYAGGQLHSAANPSGVDSRANLNWSQEKLEASQPIAVDRSSDGQIPPMDLPHIVLQQQPPPSVQWQQYVDARQDAYRRAEYIQFPNSEGGQPQQLFQQHSLQSTPVNNPLLAIHEGGIYRHSDQAQQQQRDDLFGGPFISNFISTHPPGHGVINAAAKQQVSSDPSSPLLVARQTGGGGQHVQVQHYPNAPYVEQQQPYGARVPYYNDQPNRVFRPSPSPSPPHGQPFERAVHQHELPYERLPHQQKALPEQVSLADDNSIHQQAMPHVHSDSMLQDHGVKPVHPLCEGIPISQTHHSDGSVRQVPSYAAPTALSSEGLLFYRGHQDTSCGREQTGQQERERQLLLSRQQGPTFTHSDIEYGTEQPSSLPHFHERLDESDWILQQRTQEPEEAKVHFVPRARVGRTEGDEEKQSAGLSGSCLAGPAVSYGGIGVSEDLHTLLGLRWGDSYQTRQQTEMFEPFGAPLYQLKQPVAAGNMGAIGIPPEDLQTRRLNGKMNEVAALRPGLNDQEIRTADPLQDHVMASQPANINSWLPGATQGSIEERLAGVALNPYIYSAGVESGTSSSMPMAWRGGNLGTDHAKVEASSSALKQIRDRCGSQPQDETSILGNAHETITLGEKSGNSMHVPKQRPVQLHGEDTSAVDTGHLSYMLPSVTSNTRSLEKTEASVSNPAIVSLTESNSIYVLEQNALQLQGRDIIDDDNRHSARVLQDILSNTSSLNELKEEDSNSMVATLPVGVGDLDSLTGLLKDSSTPTTVPASKTTGFLAMDDNMVLTSDDPISIGLLIDQDGTSHELEAMKDGLSKGLPLQALLVSNKVEDENMKGELENVAEDVKVQLRSSQEELSKGVEEEAIPSPDLNFEESNVEDLDNDEPDAVIAEAINCGLQTIKNADLEELRELGSGTFGTVYHGKWRGSDVAIKRIKNSCFMGKPSEQERLRADFWREACMLAHLHHPNVVAFYGVVPDGPGGTLATVTEYMVNGSLKQVMHRKDRTIDRRKRLLIAMDAAFGMEYLHGKNIVHFDLKCENLLVNMRDPQRPICKVGDLGLSKIKHQTLVSGGVRGTLPWMAPELLDGSSSMVSEKVDVFSFGIVMWELLTGEEPYANMHYGAIIGGIVNNTLRPPVPKWCDAGWRLLMERCWSADPSIRPTFTEITNGLRAMAASLPPKGQVHHVHSQAHPQN